MDPFWLGFTPPGPEFWLGFDAGLALGLFLGVLRIVARRRDPRV